MNTKSKSKSVLTPLLDHVVEERGTERGAIADLAGRLGIHENACRRYLAGGSTPNLGTLNSLIEAWEQGDNPPVHVDYDSRRGIFLWLAKGPF